jgi:hypothetical protein
VGVTVVDLSSPTCPKRIRAFSSTFPADPP